MTPTFASGDLSGDLAESISGTVKALLDVRLWLAFDIDDHGRVLAGHDDLAELDRLAQRLRAVGHPVDDAERKTFAGHVRFHTVDPHGNRVEVLERLAA